MSCTDATRTAPGRPCRSRFNVNARPRTDIVEFGNTPQIRATGLLADWADTDVVLKALVGREIRGNAVLTIPQAHA
jgi:hypothetical protein